MECKNCILVSAIITTHNRSELLERAIHSVNNQTYKNIELIVVDDASEEDHKVKNKALTKDATYHYIEHSKGGNYARNVGIELSSGKLVAFLDDDDAWHPTKIEKQVALYNESHFEVIGCGSNRIVEKNGKNLFSSSNFRKGFNGKDFSEIIFIGPRFLSSELVITKDALTCVGCFDVTLKAWQDYELLIRLSEKYVFGCVEEALVDYYANVSDPHRLTNRLDAFLDSFPVIKNKYRKRIAALSPQYKDRWRKQYLYECAGRTSSKSERRKYRKEIFLLDRSVKSFLYFILNIDFNSYFFLFYLRWRNKNNGS